MTKYISWQSPGFVISIKVFKLNTHNILNTVHTPYVPVWFWRRSRRTGLRSFVRVPAPAGTPQCGFPGRSYSPPAPWGHCRCPSPCWSALWGGGTHKKHLRDCGQLTFISATTHIFISVCVFKSIDRKITPNYSDNSLIAEVTFHASNAIFLWKCPAFLYIHYIELDIFGTLEWEKKLYITLVLKHLDGLFIFIVFDIFIIWTTDQTINLENNLQVNRLLK